MTRVRVLLDEEAGRFQRVLEPARAAGGRARGAGRRAGRGGARPVSGAGLDRRLAALAEAAELARGRLDAAAVEAADAVVARAGERLGLGVEATVVALAGPDRRRQVVALQRARGRGAGARGPPAADDLGDDRGGLGRRRRPAARLARRARSATGATDGPDGLVLLDLPDFDSVRHAQPRGGRARGRARRPDGLGRRPAEVRRRGAARALPAPVRRPRGDDARRPQPGRPARRGGGGGLRGRPRPAARRGRPAGPAGARPLRAHRRGPRRAAGGAAPARRRARGRGRAARGRRRRARRPRSPRRAAGSRRRIGKPERAALTAALAGAAGVPVVVRAVAGSHRRDGALATGWPFVRWVRRFAPDPLRRLRLGGGARPAELGPGGPARSSLPAATPVQRAAVETAARALADRAAGELARAVARARPPRRPVAGGHADRGPGRRRLRHGARAAPAALVARRGRAPAPARPRGGRRRALAPRAGRAWATSRSTTSCPRRRWPGSRSRPPCSAAGRSRVCC